MVRRHYKYTISGERSVVDKRNTKVRFVEIEKVTFEYNFEAGNREEITKLTNAYRESIQKFGVLVAAEYLEMGRVSDPLGEG